MMIVTFDLDECIFATSVLYKKAFDLAGIQFKNPSDWNLQICYPKVVTDVLYQLFKSDEIYNTPLIDAAIPNILNEINKTHKYKIFYVTQRLMQNPEKTYAQLLNNGIKCSFEQVYDKKDNKVDVLRKLKTNLHFDDSPVVVSECLKQSVPIVMISNDFTGYNHNLRNKVLHYYPDLRTALINCGVYQNKK